MGAPLKSVSRHLIGMAWPALAELIIFMSIGEKKPVKL